MAFELIDRVVSGDANLLKKFPPILEVTAEGIVTTEGWKNPLLSVVVYAVPPEDGIQDIDFVAEKPSGIVAQVETDISAKLEIEDPDIANYWGNGKSLAGVRIRAATNELEIAL